MTCKPFSLYIHVPFCAHKCPYCDFNTYATQTIPEAEYVEALLADLQRYAEDARFAGRPIGTIFFGGGTPSLLSAGAIARVIDEAAMCFGKQADAEVTLEANPSRATQERLEAFQAAGINRVSFGVQSFKPELLRALGRDHTADEAVKAVEAAVRVGLSNVSLDLMYGVPQQTLKDVEGDLEVALKLPVQHISAYALSVEPGTPFFQRQERGLLTVPADEEVAGMMDRLPELLAEQGFSRYEISNYARAGFQSRHNTVYWSGGDYLGIGAGAHSYVAIRNESRIEGGERWSTLANPQAYMAAAHTHAPVAWREALLADDLAFEFFYLGLRKVEGVSRKDFESNFGRPWDDTYGAILNELADEGFLSFSSSGVALTHEGIKLSDSVYERLVESLPERESGRS
jgi:oxygen-independent coproporphyrinogen-3 oxidase